MVDFRIYENGKFKYAVILKNNKNVLKTVQNRHLI